MIGLHPSELRPPGAGTFLSRQTEYIAFEERRGTGAWKSPGTRTKCVMKLSAPRTAAWGRGLTNRREWSGRSSVHLMLNAGIAWRRSANIYRQSCGCFFPQTPPHLCVLSWIMQGLYPALKHEWIIWPQGEAVSTFPFTSLFIYLPGRRRTRGGYVHG